jgi:hypothetical protein
MYVYMCIAHSLPFLGVFAKLRKQTVHFVMCDRLSVLLPFWVPTGRTVVKFYIFRKSFAEFQVPLKSENKEGTLHEDVCNFITISRWILLIMSNVSDKFAEKIKNAFYIAFFSRKLCRLCFSRTFLVHQVERLLASVTDGSKPSVINFTVNVHSRNL